MTTSLGGLADLISIFVTVNLSSSKKGDVLELCTGTGSASEVVNKNCVAAQIKAKICIFFF